VIGQTTTVGLLSLQGLIEGWEMLGCRSLQNLNLKCTDFVDTMKLNVLHDLPFSRNQHYIRIMENFENRSCILNSVKMERNEMILEIQDDPAFLLLTIVTHLT